MRPSALRALGAGTEGLVADSSSASPADASIPRARDNPATAARAEAARSLGESPDPALAGAGGTGSAAAARTSTAPEADEADAVAVTAPPRSPRSSSSRRLRRSSAVSAGESAVRRRRLVEEASRRERFAAGPSVVLPVFFPGASAGGSSATGSAVSARLALPLPSARATSSTVPSESAVVIAVLAEASAFRADDSAPVSDPDASTTPVSAAPSGSPSTSSGCWATSSTRLCPSRRSSPLVLNGTMRWSSTREGLTGHSGPWSGRSVSEWAPQP